MIQVPELQHLIQVIELLPISRWAIATVHFKYNLKRVKKTLLTFERVFNKQSLTN